MRVLLTSAGFETEEIKTYFMEMAGKDMALVKALFIPTAAIDAGAIEVLPKCMHDLLNCGIPDKNITVYDLHRGMDLEELQQYDIVYLCGGDTSYLLERVNATGFCTALMEYIHADGIVVGVSAGSLIFAGNLPDNLGLIDTALEVHCETGDACGQVAYPFRETIRLTNTCALAVRKFPDGIGIIGRQ